MSKTNYCFVVGNIGADPMERGKGAKNGPVVTFTVAENVQSFDEKTQTFRTLHTNWFNITAFGSIAERVRLHLKKGDRVAVHGKMRVSKYQSKTGEERVGFEIIAEDVALWKYLPGSSPAVQSA